jgi:co-chaperonin GroES (HSP10)
MQGITDYIIEFRETHKTEFEVSGHSLKINPNFNQPKWINRIGRVVSVPLHQEVESPIKKGYEVIVVHTSLLNDFYDKVGKSRSSFLVDDKKDYFRFTPNLIVMYRESNKHEWKSHLDSVFISPIKIDKEKKKTPKGLLLPDSIFEKEKGYKGNQTQQGIVAYSNNNLTKLGIYVGDEVMFKIDREYEFKINGKTLWHMENNDIILHKKTNYK